MTRSIVAFAVIAAACGSAAIPRRFENDYEAARVEAKRQNLPLAVEVWAPW